MRKRTNATAGAVTPTSASRRRFLQGSTLAALGTTAATLLPAASSSAADSTVPANCPAPPAAPMKDVAGRVAFITGGDSGIGLGVARAFADAGMKVVITYRTKAHLDEAMKLLEGAGDRVHAVNVDVTDRPALAAAADEAVKKFGKVHVLVANAGVAIIGGIGTATYDDWDWGMGINSTGVFNSIRTFLPRIKAQGEGGHIIATSSLAGLLAHPVAGVYTASKYAVVGMMEALRGELANTNIGVTVFCPGLVNTNIGTSNRNRPTTLADSGFKIDPAMMARMPQQMRQMQGPPPGMDPLEAGQRVLHAMQNNDLYVLTTPEYEGEFAARAEAINASLPTDVVAPPMRINIQKMLVGASVYTPERDRKRCERARAKKA